MRLFALTVVAVFAASTGAFAQAESLEHETGNGEPHQNEGKMEHSGESAPNAQEHGDPVHNAGQHGANSDHTGGVFQEGGAGHGGAESAAHEEGKGHEGGHSV